MIPRIVAVAMNVPFLGGVLRLLVMLTGLGLMIVVGRSAWASRGRPQFA